MPAVSDLALIIWAAADESLAHDGMRPQRIARGLLRILADDRDGLGGSNIVARTPILFPRDGSEVLFNDLLSPRKSIAPAHKMIMADWMSVSQDSSPEAQG